MMNHLPRLVLTSAAAAFVLAASVVAQTSPCPSNLVINGGFENVLFDQWTVAGPQSVSYATGAVDGLNQSRCLVIPAGGAYSITQPTAFTLTGNELYELAWDVDHSSCCYGRLYSADLVDPATGAVAVTLLTGDVSRVGRSTPSVRFSVPQTGSFLLRINIATGNDAVALDNVRIRPNRVLMRVDGVRFANVNSQYTVFARPNEYMAILVSGGLLQSPIPVNGCFGEWWLVSPTLVLTDIATMDSNGVKVGTFRVPTSVRGVPISFQPVILPTTCGLGCPQTYAFF